MNLSGKTMSAHTDRLEKSLQAMQLTPANLALARACLAAEHPDAAALSGAAPQDFSLLGQPQRKEAGLYAQACRKAGRRGELARFKQLAWAIGKSSAAYVLYDLSSYEAADAAGAEMEENSALLGKPAAAALMAEAAAWQTHTLCRRALAPLAQLAASDPEALAEAQKLQGTKWDNAHIVLIGEYLHAQPAARPSGLFGRLHAAPQKAQARAMADFLLKNALDTLDNMVGARLNAAEQEPIRAFLRAADPAAPLTPELCRLLEKASCDANKFSPRQTLSGYNPYLATLLGVCSYLAQEYDPRQRAVVRLCIALSPAAVLSNLVALTPENADPARTLLPLCGEIPGGAVSFALFLAMNCRYGFGSAWRSPLMQALVQTDAGAVAEALRRADAQQYEKLVELLHGLNLPAAQRLIGAGMAEIRQHTVDGLLQGLSAGQSAAADFLAGKTDASLSHLAGLQASPQYGVISAGQLMQNPSRYSISSAGRLLQTYIRMGAAADDPLLPARGLLLLAAMGQDYLVAQICGGSHGAPDLDSMRSTVEMLRVGGADLDGVLTVLGSWYQCMYSDKNRADMFTYARQVLCGQTEYVPQLPAAARQGGLFARMCAYDVMDALCARHPEFRAELLAGADDSARQVREKTAGLLAGHRGWEPEVLALLGSKKSAGRETALAVLRQWGIAAYRPAVEQALQTEKSVKLAAEMRAALGEPGEPAAAPGTAPQQTLAELTADVLKGGKARRVQWLLDAGLPALHLQGRPQEEIGADRTAALLAECCQNGCTPAAQRLADGIEPAELAAFAAAVYDVWLASGAQSKQKWVLPFAAVYGGSAVTQRLVHAIGDWPLHARGAIACDAVGALALSPDPAALLTVDSLSRKCKFRQIKEAAGRALETAARARGITAEELADRIVPDLGLDAGGSRVFDYGPRRFTVTLTPALEAEVRTEDGRLLKSMPAPGRADDPEKAAAAAEEFRQMKKQIRTAVAAQKLRLDTALSSLRTWDRDAWTALFVRNPLMRQFAAGLIWGVYEDGRLQQSFRYLDDGSFSTAGEEEYTPAEGARIGLVHPVELDAAALAAWQQQLADYEITQPVLQLSRPVLRVTEAERTARAFERFAGKKLSVLSLSSRLLGQGWYRGSVQDGGSYDTFFREDPTLGLAAELHFSGSYIGDESTVTVYETVFYKAGTVRRGSYVYDTVAEQNVFALGDVPARYFSEIACQLQKAAAAASETDPDWKQAEKCGR